MCSVKIETQETQKKQKKQKQKNQQTCRSDVDTRTACVKLKLQRIVVGLLRTSYIFIKVKIM